MNILWSRLKIPFQTFELLDKKTSNSLDDTRLIASAISQQLSSGLAIGFSGDLGVGKTELIRAICEKLGDASLVSSPTYTLENQYQLSENICVSHWDLYRLGVLGEVQYELEELKASEKALILIEWPELVVDLLDLLVLISFADFERREVSIYGRKGLEFRTFIS